MYNGHLVEGELCIMDQARKISSTVRPAVGVSLGCQEYGLGCIMGGMRANRRQEGSHGVRETVRKPYSDSQTRSQRVREGVIKSESKRVSDRET